MKNLSSNQIDAAHRATGIQRLFIFGWRGSIVSLLVALIALFFLFGFWWPYWRVGDMDIWMVYEAFLYNDGLPQEYFDHPAYLTILFLGRWFAILHSLGLLPVHSLSELPPVADVSASALAWTRATQAARLLSLFFGLAFVTSFAWLLRTLVGYWRIAALAAFALAFSGGFMMESRIVRTELLASGFAYSALLISLIAAQRVTSGWRPALVGIAALFASLAMLNKVQVLFLLAAFPPILFLFGRKTEAPPVWSARRHAFVLTGAFIAAAAFVTIWIWPVVTRGLFDALATTDRRQLYGSQFPIYQMLIAAWILGWMLAYAIYYRVGALESISAIAAVIAGAGLGLAMLMLHLNIQTVVAVMNPIEKMLGIMTAYNPAYVRDGAVSGETFVHTLRDGLGLLLARRTFFLSSSARPTLFLEWLVLLSAVFAWRRDQHKAVLQAGGLIATVYAVDLIGTFRGLKLEYFIITDPLVIIAAAWLLVRTPALQSHRWTYRVVLSLLIVTVCIGLAEPVKHTFKRDIPLDFCVPYYGNTQRIERFSFCPL